MTIPINMPKHEGNSVDEEYFDSLLKKRNPDDKGKGKHPAQRDVSPSPNNLGADTSTNNDKPEGIRLENTKN